MTGDFVTIVKLSSRANKLIRRERSGDLIKEPGPPIVTAAASTVHVPDTEAMVNLLTEVANDANIVIIPSGYFPGSEPDCRAAMAMGTSFRISSKSFLAKYLGVEINAAEKLLGWHEIDGERHIARLKANMQPGSWMLIDRDEVKGMPSKLAEMPDDEWLFAMNEMIPGLADTRKIKVPSSTGRVLVDGKPMSASGQHYYIQIMDGTDLDRFGALLLQRSFLQEYGFMRPLYSRDGPTKVVGQRQWSIFDPTTFSRERLAYEGAPTIEGKGLTLGPARIEIL